MNKTALKNFAIAARLEMLQRVMNRANIYGVNEEICKEGSFAPSSGFQKLGGDLLTREEEIQRDALIRRVAQQGYRQTMEEAAYTWFNRFIALRYMQEHQLLPVSQRVLPEMPGQMPEIIREAHQLSLDGLDMSLVLDLLDRNDNTTLYRYLLIALCNTLHEPLPQMFEKISDYTELLFPDGLLKDDSVLAALSKIPAEDFQDIQVIGWLYQYYNTDLKNETFELLKKNVKITKERIGAATQLFTPEWIVRYMVQNSLGRLWLEGHPEENLRMSWRYYMDEAEQEPEVAAKLAEIRKGYAAMQLEDIKLLDPCMGSGHILVYAFDLLMEIYRTMGYTDRDAVRSIVENNLYGLDIDDRAAQLAYFAVMMKACEYDRRFLRRGIQPHVCAVQGSDGMPEDAWALFGAQKDMAQALYHAFAFAKDYGSLVTVKASPDDLALLENRMEEMKQKAEYGDLTVQAQTASALAAMQPLMEQARILAQKYDVVVTNPPYMGSSGMNDRLSKFVKDNYPDSKSDLFAVFMERGMEWVKQNGYSSMVTMQSWMFLSSFEKLRSTIINQKCITALMHMENMVMGIAFGTAVAVIRNNITRNYKGTYNHIEYEDIVDAAPKEFPVAGNRFAQVATENFRKIPGMPVAYWVSEQFINAFVSGEKLKLAGDTRQGMATSDNNRFLRFWHEVNYGTIAFGCGDARDAYATKCKWFPYNKGGDFRKWYGNVEYILNYEDDGKELKGYAASLYGSYSRTIKSESEYFKECLSWSKVSSGTIAFRYYPRGFIFDVAGCCIFYKDILAMKYHFAFINSCVAKAILEAISPTINYETGHIASLPIIDFEETANAVGQANNNIHIAKHDWDSFETSWDFKKHPLI